MVSPLLFPRVFRPIGFVLILGGLILGYIFIVPGQVISFLDSGSGNLTDEFASTFVILGLLFTGFARLKNENERSIQIRLNALYWAVLASFLFLFFYWGLEFVGNELKITAFYHMPTLETYYLHILLSIFVARFYYALSRDKNDGPVTSVYLFPYKPWLPAVRCVCVFFFLLIIADTSFSWVDSLLKKIIPIQVYLLFPANLLMWLWSKEKNENDIQISARLKAMQVAVFINYGLFLIATWSLYSIDYLMAEITGLMSTPIIFLCIFYYKLYMLRKKASSITPSAS